MHNLVAVVIKKEGFYHRELRFGLLAKKKGYCVWVVAFWLVFDFGEIRIGNGGNTKIKSTELIIANYTSKTVMAVTNKKLT